MLDLGSLKIGIKVDGDAAKRQLADVEKTAAKSASNLKSNIMGGVKAISVGMATTIAAASAAVIGLTKKAVDNYASYQQLAGGVETLFGNSADTIKNYAQNAYQTAGMSANAYMQTVTGFSASLLSSLGGDTKAAAEVANSAVVDMADNANKMGTSIESIQNAYQGFAKQNYTMLDNLKLGYGGTKEEMQRLLKDAEKISGVKYDISSFSDVTKAIHVMQEEMGIAGTTAKEATATIEGSANAMKSAWDNLLTGLADKNANMDVLINQLVESTKTFAKNILPVAKQALEGIGTLISELLPEILREAPKAIGELLPEIIESGMNISNALMDGFVENAPVLMEGLMKSLEGIFGGMDEFLPKLLQFGLTMIISLANGIAESAPTLMPQIINLLLTVVDTLVANLPMLIDAGINMVISLGVGLINALPMLIEKLPAIIDGIVSALANGMPKIAQVGITLFVGLIKNLPAIIVSIVKAIPQIMTSLIDGFKTYISNMEDVGKDLLNGLWDGIKSVWSSITGWFDDKINWIKDKFGGISKTIGKVFGSHRTGLREVPYDGYVAELHRGEMVLTAAEANQYQRRGYSQQQQQGNSNIVVNNYSPVALNEAESARQFRKAQRELAFGF